MQQNKKSKKENADTLRKNLEDKIPKNVRQIGSISQSTKIYIQELVINYLKRLQKDVQQKGEKFSAILIGEKHVAPKANYFFIVGAIKLEVDIKKINGILADETKKQITRTVESYFGKENSALCQIGWSSEVQVENKIQGEYEKFHRENFGSGNTLFLGLYEDGEEIFYINENGKLKKQTGYYVYFERNEGMQQYISDNQPTKSVDMENVNRTETYRMLLANKKEDIQHKHLITFLYTASTFLVMVVIVLGVTLINHNDKLKDMQNVIASLSKDVINSGRESGDAVPSDSDEIQTMAQYDEYQDNSLAQNSSGQANEAASSEAVAASEGAALETSGEDVSEDTNNSALEQNDKNDDNSAQTLSEISEQEYIANEQEFLEKNFRRYEVQEGDTLIGICKKLYGSQEYLDKICQYNHIDNSDEIIVGQKIWVP